MAITGQRLLRQEWQAFYPDVDLNQAKKIPAMNAVGESWVCQRCGNLSQEALPAGFFYCPACLVLGRISSHSFLYYFPVKELSARKVVLAWSGVFSSAQEKIARRLVTDLRNGKTFLLWAVTGAGKTEILFPLIKAVLEKGQRVVL
ncbi:MAG: DEAD/DEAH box helicase family protein, partial [Enterococcus viikkiensis]